MRFRCLLCLVVLSLTVQAGATGVESRSRLVELIERYEEQKLAWQKYDRVSKIPKRRRGKKQQVARPEPLDKLLRRIAALRTKASLGYLIREYRTESPDVAAACAVAILEEDGQRAIDTLVKGFNRGGKWPATALVRVVDVFVASGGRPGVEFARKLALKGKDELRAIATLALAQLPKEARTVDAVVGNLSAKTLAVRRAAMRAAAHVKSKDLISTLIERLESEKNETLRRDALVRLLELTGANMGYVVADWKKWWQFEEKDFRFDRKESGSTQVVKPKLEYFGIGVSAKKIMFLVDASMSMQGRQNSGGGGRGGARGRGGRQKGEQKIDALRRELSRIVEKLPEDTWINIVPFHAKAVPWKKELYQLKGKRRDEALEFIKTFPLALKTNVYDALEFALRDRHVEAIYVLSDGRPIGGKITDPEDIVRDVTARNRVRGMKIHCISFGAETAFMKDLAKKNDGEYRSTAKKKNKGGKKRRKQGGDGEQQPARP